MAHYRSYWHWLRVQLALMAFLVLVLFWLYGGLDYFAAEIYYRWLEVWHYSV